VHDFRAPAPAYQQGVGHEGIFSEASSSLSPKRTTQNVSKFFSKTFKFSITFYSTWQISGGGQCRKADPRKKNRNSRKSRENSRNLLEAFLRSRKEENLYGHCDVNNARRILSKGSTLLRGCWFWLKKLHFQKNFGWNFIAVEGVTGCSPYFEPHSHGPDSVITSKSLHRDLRCH